MDENFKIDYEQRNRETNRMVTIPDLTPEQIAFVEWTANMIEEDYLWHGSENNEWEMYGECVGTISELFQYYIEKIYQK